jgi:hypothetical protein
MEDFFKKVYNSEDKSVTAWYYVKNDTSTQITLLNVQEKESPGKIWASGAVDYFLRIKEVKLPKSQIKVLSHDETRNGHFLIKIPYWLFKKNDGLEIIRIPVHKKFTIKPDDPMIDNFVDKHYSLALKGAGTNMEHIEIVYNNLLKSRTPKSTPSELVKMSQEIFKPYGWSK